METQQNILPYDRAEAERIARILAEGPCAPEYILLFGKLAGGTPHSEATAYDLLMVVGDTPDYDWREAKRLLNIKLPAKQRKIPLVNLYIATLNELNTQRTAFLYLALLEGEPLYCKEHRTVQRPKRRADFGRVCGAIGMQTDLLVALGDRLLEQAAQNLEHPLPERIRLAAHQTAQAAVQYYEALHRAYHNCESGTADLALMHERMRTLSPELMLLFDSTPIEPSKTLARLRTHLKYALSDPKYDISVAEAAKQLKETARMGKIVAASCWQRLELYKQKSEE